MASRNARRLLLTGYCLAFVEFDDGEDDEDLEEEITEPWTCTCQKTLILSYENVMSAQAELDEISRPLGGYSDGWGTMGNAERQSANDKQDNT